jgi:hypothetical protein
MTETSLAIARKVVLCAGLLVSALLFLYPHWRLSIDFRDGTPAINQGLGRGFITSPPSLVAASSPAQSTAGARPVISRRGVLMMGGDGPVYRINYVRQFTEVAIALLFTFGLMSALKLKKPVGDRKHDAEE